MVRFERTVGFGERVDVDVSVQNALRLKLVALPVDFPSESGYAMGNPRLRF